jgi:hypothetical protein
MSSFFRVLVSLAFAALGTLPTTASAQQGPDVPAAIRVPDGNVLLFRGFAAGSQNYECVGSTWTFRQPKAVLVSDSGEQLGIHGRGPFWASYDGSSVVGSAPVSAPGRDPAQDVPLLLLRGTPGDADGQFASVTYIQRLDTRGGAAPAGACDPEQQPTLAVPYLAVYYFYAASSAGVAAAT